MWLWFTPLLHHGEVLSLAAALDIENAKAAKYRSVAMERRATFSAFIVESYGALGGQGMELLKLLNSTLNHAPARHFELSERVVEETFSVACSVAMPSYPTRAV